MQSPTGSRGSPRGGLCHLWHTRLPLVSQKLNPLRRSGREDKAGPLLADPHLGPPFCQGPPPHHTARHLPEMQPPCWDRSVRGDSGVAVFSLFGVTGGQGQPSPSLGSAAASPPAIVRRALAHLRESEVEMMVLGLAGIWAFIRMAPNQPAWPDHAAYMACGLCLNELSLFSPQQ